MRISIAILLTIFIMLSACVSSPIMSNNSSIESDVTTAAIGQDSTPEIIYPDLSAFQLDEISDMTPQDILVFLEKQNFDYQKNGYYWENTMTGVAVVIWFKNSINEEFDRSKALEEGLAIESINVFYEFPNVLSYTWSDIENEEWWWGICPEIASYVIRECSLDNEIMRGYQCYGESRIGAYGAYGICNFGGEEGYWEVGLNLNGDILVSIQPYGSEKDSYYMDKDTVIEVAKQLNETIDNVLNTSPTHHIELDIQSIGELWAPLNTNKS